MFQLDVKHTISETELNAGVSYQRIDQDDQRFTLRQPGRTNEAFVTQNSEADIDLFNAHASSATRINEQFLLTAGYAFTYIDTDTAGNRIYGSAFDSIYDPFFRGRAPRDEGFLDLNGSTIFRQHEANLNLLYTPWENVAIIPSLRVSKQDESADANFTTTDFTSAGVATFTPIYGNNDRAYLDVAEAVELCYTGFTNWLLYARGEWTEDDGDLNQLELPLDTPEDQDLLREDADRFTQKYTVGLNWYPLRRFNLGAQYYHKTRDYDYANKLGPPPSDYPGFIQDQKFDTDDANFRISLRPLNNVTLVTRYDFQLSRMFMTGDSLGEVQSGETTTHIISQSASWSPLPRLVLQGNFNYVLDSTDTPGDRLGGIMANQIQQAENNYWDAGALVGYALDDKTDLQLEYFYYRADDYQNNSAFSQPYGAGEEQNGVTVTLLRQLSRSIRWTLKYGFFSNHDQTYGGHKNYNAHLVYSSLQYRF